LAQLLWVAAASLERAIDGLVDAFLKPAFAAESAARPFAVAALEPRSVAAIALKLAVAFAMELLEFLPLDHAVVVPIHPVESLTLRRRWGFRVIGPGSAGQPQAHKSCRDDECFYGHRCAPYIYLDDIGRRSTRPAAPAPSPTNACRAGLLRALGQDRLAVILLA